MLRFIIYLRRALIALAGLVVVLVAGLLIFTNTARFRILLRDEALSALASSFRGRIGISAIEGSIWGNLTFRDLTLDYQGKRVLAAPRMHVGYALLPLIHGQVRVGSVELEEPVLDVVRESDGTWNLLDAFQSPKVLQAPTTKKAGYQVYLNSIQIRRGHIRLIPSGARQYELVDTNLDLSGQILNAGMTFDVNSLAFRLRSEGYPEMLASAKASYQSSGTEQSAQIKNITLQTQHSKVRVFGTVPDIRALKLDVSLALDRLAAQDLAFFVPNKNFREDISGAVKVNGAKNDLHAALRLAAGEAQIRGTARADLAAAEVRYETDLTATKLDVRKLTGDQRLAGVAEARISAKGVGKSLSGIDGRADVTVQNIAFQTIRLQSAKLNATLAHQKGEFRAELLQPPGKIVSNGSLVLAAAPNYQIKFSGSQVDLSRIKQGQQQTNLNFNGAVDGKGITLATAAGNARLNVGPSSVGQVKIANGRLEASIASQRVHIAQASIRAEDTTADARGDLGLGDRAPVNLGYSLNSANIGPWLALAGQKGQGQLSLTGGAGGDAANLHAWGKVSTAGLKLGANTIRQGTVTYDLQKPSAQDPYGNVNVALAELTMGAKLKQLNTQVLIVPQTPRLVQVSAQALDYQNHHDSLQVEASYAQGQVGGRISQLSLQLGKSNWALNAPALFTQDQTGLTIRQFALSSGSQRLAIDGNFARHGSQRMMVALDRFDLGSLKDLVVLHTDLNGSMSTRIEVWGTASSPQISVTSTIDNLKVANQTYAGLAANASYSMNRATVAITFRQDMQHALFVNGGVPLQLTWDPAFQSRFTGDLDLRAYSPGLSLAFLSVMAPDKLRDVDGYVTVNATAHGPIANPTMAGSIAIPNGKAMVVPLRVNVEQIALEVQFAPGTVRLARLSAKAGDGSINGSGQLVLHGYAPDRIDASISLDRWPAISTPQYVAHTSGRVRLAGLVATPAITGNIDVTDATLKPDLSMLDSNRVKPDPTIQVVRLSTNNFVETPADEQVQITKAQPTAIFRDYSADLVITIERNAWIRHTNATVNLDGHLHIQKKLDSSLRISGIIEALHGWVQFQQRRFMVKHGVVSFGGGPEIDPVLDLTAENKIRSYTVAINVNGTAKKPSLVLTSTPELEQADILSLILFGRTTQDLTDRQQAKLGQQAATMAGGFAASQLASSVTNALGLQDVGLDVGQVDAGGDSGIGVGHYFTDDVYVSVSHGLTGQGDKLSLDYYLTHDLSISTSATYSKGASGAAPAASNNSGTNSEIGATWQRRY